MNSIRYAADMQTFKLSDEELRSLRVAHREAKNKRSAYRINAMILVGQGWTVTQVAEALLLDEGTIRNYILLSIKKAASTA